MSQGQSSPISDNFFHCHPSVVEVDAGTILDPSTRDAAAMTRHFRQKLSLKLPPRAEVLGTPRNTVCREKVCMPELPGILSDASVFFLGGGLAKQKRCPCQDVLVSSAFLHLFLQRNSNLARNDMDRAIGSNPPEVLIRWDDT